MATESPSPINLTHHFLIAMPGLEDEAFSKSVIYMCEHSERGALGLVINKPSDINVQGLFDKVELPLRREDLTQTPVFQGGPVQTERGFVLHESMMPGNESVYASTMSIPGGLEMTTSKDVLPVETAKATVLTPVSTRPNSDSGPKPPRPPTGGGKPSLTRIK